MTPKARTFWPVLLIVVLADCASKDVAVRSLNPFSAPREFLGTFVRLKLAYNPGSSFSFDWRPYFGSWAKPVMILFILTAVGALLRMYRRADPRARLGVAGVALAAGGALGNLLDRLIARPGVVDFLDLGIGSQRFFICNVADIGVTVGAVLLGIALLRQPSLMEPESTETV
jgi:signal peptidase II